MARNRNNHAGAKCCVCTLGTLVLLCLALLVFAAVVIHVKNPIIRIDSIEVKSAKYDLYPHLFLELDMLMRVYLENRAYGHMQFPGNKTLELHYGAASVLGLTELKLGLHVGSREHEVIEVKINATSIVSKDGNGLKKVDELKLNQDLNSGFLNFTAKAAVKGKVYLVKNKITRSTEAIMNCDIVINLKKKTVQKLTCY
ncbi:hypothetical protein RND81_06G247000 [Saponaria officinalis]|uniref:Late embryogenesis abundant protein LEA-2 subgroup domain-containing protein n=1 Tax=Saponaria officinalis TaxID=3572 RepID=A0AAW1KAH1_SAPOF